MPPNVPAALPNQVAVPQPTQPAKPKQRWRLPIGAILFGLLVIGLIVATIVALPGISIPNIPQITAATATTQVLTQQVFTINDIELVVPDGQDVRASYTTEFLRQARQQFGETTVINQNAPPSFIGTPQEVGAATGGKRYRASMQGFVLVPQR
jgi:hypothetical protein